MSLTINQTVSFTSKGVTFEGTIVKLNPKRAVLKLTKGSTRFAPGTELTVPYSMLGTGDYGHGTPPCRPLAPPPSVKSFEANEFWVRQYATELLILGRIFNELSPENLCCDGELPMYQVEVKRAKLNRKLDAVYILLGQDIDETQLYDIMAKYRKAICDNLTQVIKCQERFLPTDPAKVDATLEALTEGEVK